MECDGYVYVLFCFLIEGTVDVFEVVQDAQIQGTGL